ncbi:MAG: diaminopimelate decarboxylase, partial [Kingella oralis]
MNNTNYPRLAAQYGTPLYVYHQAALTAAFAAYQTAFSGCQPLVCYAVKANGNLSLIRRFAELGSGFDIVSGGELARVLAAGGDAAKTIFSGVGKSEAEIEFALHAGVKCFNM